MTDTSRTRSDGTSADYAYSDTGERHAPALVPPRGSAGPSARQAGRQDVDPPRALTALVAR